MSGSRVELADLSLSRFLAWEERQELRYERLGGVVRAMAGGSLRHDRIAGNLRVFLHPHLRRRGCDDFGSDVKVASPRGDVTYPDLSVRCGPYDPNATTIEDPVLVVEVLSPSTAQRDLTLKRQAYESIPSLRVILYVWQDQPRIDVVRRGADGRWDDDEPAVGPDATLALPELGIEIPLAAVYEGVSFEEAEGGPA
ncbi:MAG: Uma2 family endonuclease [Geminicoccaceae bacterium]|nr:Uma2 family endonuclease [Geminicoccaceae bacterium]